MPDRFLAERFFVAFLAPFFAPFLAERRFTDFFAPFFAARFVDLRPFRAPFRAPFFAPFLAARFFVAFLAPFFDARFVDFFAPFFAARLAPPLRADFLRDDFFGADGVLEGEIIDIMSAIILCFSCLSFVTVLLLCCRAAFVAPDASEDESRAFQGRPFNDAGRSTEWTLAG
ncbi:MAG TPA: hypothetical protein VNE58_05870 [Casimicrobiaceae bacterium]|nr:hypothetical protein [Casimicrobiaceae bacterium]